jgi:uncharacterized membrane protein
VSSQRREVTEGQSNKKILTMKNQGILASALCTFAVLLALTSLLIAGPREGGLNSHQRPFAPTQPAIITFDPPGSTGTVPSAITSNGLIIGSYFDTAGLTHGFIRTTVGTFTTFDAAGSASTTPTSISPDGVITGWYGDFGDGHGFLRALDGSITSFDAPPGGSIFGSIFIFGGPPPSINPSGAIAGTYFDASFVEHGFLRTPNGNFITIDYPGADFTEALAINASGVIVGDFCDATTCFAGFLRTPDGMFKRIDLPGCAPADQNTPAVAINSAGAVVGFAYCNSLGPNVSGYLRAPNGNVTVFDPAGSEYTAPFAINAAGAITGYYCDAVGCHGFVRSPGGAIATFDPPGSTFTVPVAINAMGVITGVFSDASGALHGFLRTP